MNSQYWKFPASTGEIDIDKPLSRQSDPLVQDEVLISQEVASYVKWNSGDRWAPTPHGTQYYTDFYDIDSYNAMAFNYYHRRLEEAYYDFVALVDATESESQEAAVLSELKRALHIYQMADIMHTWAGSVRDEWDKAWDDKSNPIHKSTSDDMYSDWIDMRDNLSHKMSTLAKDSDQWHRASIMFDYLKNPPSKFVSETEERFQWWKMRKFYDAYSIAFMDD